LELVLINKINVNKLQNQFKRNKPFKHVVIDNFFTSDVAEFLEKNFPKMNEMPTIFKEPMSYKGQLSDIKRYLPKFKKHFDFLQSKNFRTLMGDITEIPNLLKDGMLAGAGLHQSPRSGFLDIHVDANKHPFDKKLHRRLNLIIYLNKDWKEEYGGAIELWSDDKLRPGQIQKKVLPKFNRAVIFATTRTSWHGVEQIKCPKNISRKSIALYYYTTDRPEEEMYEDSSVIWFGKSRLKKIIYPVLNYLIKKLKPYAKYIRRNVFDSKK
jgi:Rps23 Pro-64 3,4-dihydroxylase Tpa1-like proline 4-hydroxylase